MPCQDATLRERVHVWRENVSDDALAGKVSVTMVVGVEHDDVGAIVRPVGCRSQPELLRLRLVRGGFSWLQSRVRWRGDHVVVFVIDCLRWKASMPSARLALGMGRHSLTSL